MKNKFLLIALVAVVAMPLASFADTSACVSNVNGTGVTAQVCYNIDGSNVLTITSFTSNVAGGFSGAKLFTILVGNDVTFIPSAAKPGDACGDPSTLYTCTTPPASQGSGGFTGPWSSMADSNTGADAVTYPFSGISFTLSGVPTDIDFHIGGLGTASCSLWISNQTANGGSPSDCGTTSTPEPSGLAPLGLGLIGLVEVVRRRFLR